MNKRNKELIMKHKEKLEELINNGATYQQIVKQSQILEKT